MPDTWLAAAAWCDRGDQKVAKLQALGKSPGESRCQNRCNRTPLNLKWHLTSTAYFDSLIWILWYGPVLLDGPNLHKSWGLVELMQIHLWRLVHNLALPYPSSAAQPHLLLSTEKEWDPLTWDPSLDLLCPHRQGDSVENGREMLRGGFAAALDSVWIQPESLHVLRSAPSAPSHCHVKSCKHPFDTVYWFDSCPYVFLTIFFSFTSVK